MTKSLRIQEPPRFVRGWSSAFSLVEVTLALGIMGFSLVAIFGLLPFGLNIFRQTIDTTVQAQIAQEMTSVVQRTPFSQIIGLGTEANPTRYYFDDEGTRLNAASSRSVYTAMVFVPGTDATTLLAPMASNGALNNLTAVRIVIGRSVLMPDNAASGSVLPATAKTSVTYVANSGF